MQPETMAASAAVAVAPEAVIPASEAHGTGAAAAGEAGGPRIIQLEETVINRIAAGEVVVRPANALKELMENSLDAGSTRIMVSVKAGGMKMLRIEDDGHGIHLKDLPILCERFTTSKLTKYEDLSSIGTFGFRGEALASISHVARVTVNTMRKEDTCAHMAQYIDGKLRAPPRPCAGTQGTTLMAEDLFYNNTTRQQALGKDSIEHNKILEVMQKYAVHYPKVAFSCRKAGATMAELHTPGGVEATALDAISVIYGQNVARELFQFETRSEDPSFTCKGFATGPNWTSKTLFFTTFINHRLVECSCLRRAVDAVYASVLPRHQHPWVYIALELDAATVDVNVHPTKSEVQFLNEELIAQRLQEVLQEQLKERGGSRNFDTRISFLGGKLTTRGTQAKQGGDIGSIGETKLAAAADRADGKPEPKKVELNPTRVRTDHLQRSLDSVWRDPQSKPVQPEEVEEQPLMEEADEGRPQSFTEAQQLTSICELKAALSVAADAEVTKKLNRSIFVGPATHDLVLLQCGGTLCLANLTCLARECAYQRLLRKFGGPGSIILKDPLPLQELIRLGILDPRSGYNEAEHASVDVEELTVRLTGLLVEKAEMLNEYLMLEVSKGMLQSLPNALGLSSSSGLNLEGLPLFLVRLCVETHWNDEKACFSSLCRLVADFCVEVSMPNKDDAAARDLEVQDSKAAVTASINAAVESGEFADVVEAAIARRKRQRTAGPQALQELRWVHEAIRNDGECQWPAAFAKDGTLLDLVSLEQLYKIFERC